MTRILNALRTTRPSWPAVLLFTALLAQAPHAAAVFIRIAPHDAQWEVVTSFVGAWVYAIALEGATAYFVWRSKLRWAVAFAVFSVAHNVAYYMPAAWTFDVYGATLTLRYVFSAILISMSLPVAIAAFSHVQAESARRDDNKHVDATPIATQPAQDATPAATATQSPVAPVAPDVADDALTAIAQQDARAAALQMASEGCSVAQIAAQVDAKPATVRSWIARERAKRNGEVQHA